MHDQEALKRIEASIEAVMYALRTRPETFAQAAGGPEAPQAAGPEAAGGPPAAAGALAALDDGIELFARRASPHDPAGGFARAGMRLFHCALYLGSIWRAEAVRCLMEALGDKAGNPLRRAFTSFFLMHFSLRTGHHDAAQRAYDSLQKVTGIPPEHQDRLNLERPHISVFNGSYRPGASDRPELILPSPPYLMRAYLLSEGAAPADVFPFQHLTGLEGYSGVLAEASVNRIRHLATLGEPAKAGSLCDSQICLPDNRDRPGFMLPACCAAASAWARAGDSERTIDSLSRLPPQPWPSLSNASELSRLCVIESYRNSGDLDAAVGLYRSWPTQDLRDLRSVPFALSTARLIGSMCRAGAVGEARRLARGLSGLGGNLALEASRAEAALGVMDSLAAKGRFRKASTICRRIVSMAGEDSEHSYAWSLFGRELERIQRNAGYLLIARLSAKGSLPWAVTADLARPAAGLAVTDFCYEDQSWPGFTGVASAAGPQGRNNLNPSPAAAPPAPCPAAGAPAASQAPARPISFYAAAKPSAPLRAAGPPAPFPAAGPPVSPRPLKAPAHSRSPKARGASPAAAAAGVFTDLAPGTAAKAASVLENRVGALLRRRAPLAAARVLSCFDALPPSREAAAARLRAAALTIDFFARAGELAAAEALYKATGLSAGARLHPQLLQPSALAFMNAALAAGSPRSAAWCFLGLPPEGPQEALDPSLREAAARTVRSLLLHDDLDLAEWMCRCLESLGRFPDTAALRAKSALDLILALEAKGLLSRSMAVYFRMESSPPKAEAARAAALRAMLAEAARTGRRERLAALEDTVRGFGEAREALTLQVTALREISALRAGAAAG
ncbi:MAG: hypothetical protein LBW85_04435, partial [Deltaproteobacteria bacterium]|nr:hypothetical protein [Deltaproteobacteria bacterium]